MSVEKQDELAKQLAKVEKQAKDATSAHVTSFVGAGKIVCIIEERLNDLKSDRNPDGTPKKRLIAANTSLAAYFESITKTKLNNHWLSCALAFGTYVRSELITEEVYDKQTGRNLEIAASISTAVGGDVTHSAVLEAADELKDCSKDADKFKNLKAILDSVKPAKPMTPEKAKELIARLIAEGMMTTVVIPAIGAEIANLQKVEDGKIAFFAMDTAMSMFAQNKDENGAQRFDEKTMQKWYDELSARENPAPPVQVVAAGQPVAPVENAPEAVAA
jgi:hypothetical protein